MGHGGTRGPEKLMHAQTHSQLFEKIQTKAHSAPSIS